jgi:hypothetical protein
MAPFGVHSLIYQLWRERISARNGLDFNNTGFGSIVKFPACMGIVIRMR